MPLGQTPERERPLFEQLRVGRRPAVGIELRPGKAEDRGGVARCLINKRVEELQVWFKCLQILVPAGDYREAATGRLLQSRQDEGFRSIDEAGQTDNPLPGLHIRHQLSPGISLLQKSKVHYLPDLLKLLSFPPVECPTGSMVTAPAPDRTGPRSSR